MSLAFPSRSRRPRRTWAMVLTLLLALTMAAPGAMGEERITIWGTPPKEKPHFTKAAEGFPPLPLPVVPMRRSEKKRPPAPPKLIANLSDFSFRGWQGSPGSVDTLLANAKRDLDIWYGWEQLSIAQVQRKHEAGVDHRTPILYLCAYYPLELTEAQRQALVSYVLSGGTLLINCCGQDAAYASARAELGKMFPNYLLRRLPIEHPLYHSYFDMQTVRYPAPAAAAVFDEAPAAEGEPRIQAIELGTRAAVILSYEDLACGWNQWNNPTVKRVSPADSTKLGVNIVTYVTAEQRLAKFLAETREVAGPTVRPRQQLSIVQLMHQGNWNPNPSGLPLLLKEVAGNTSIAVKFDATTLPLRDATLFDHPLLYMTGTYDPALGRDEAAILHRHLQSGGTLIADAAAGRRDFDEGFRKLCAAMYPDHPLTPLPPDHPLFKAFAPITSAKVNHEPDAVQPRIEAVVVEGRAVVLYSPLGLGDGWAHQFSVYARCYETKDALILGQNMVVFAMQ